MINNKKKSLKDYFYDNFFVSIKFKLNNQYNQQHNLKNIVFQKINKNKILMKIRKIFKKIKQNKNKINQILFLMILNKMKMKKVKNNIIIKNNQLFKIMK